LSELAEFYRTRETNFLAYFLSRQILQQIAATFSTIVTTIAKTVSEKVSAGISPCVVSGVNEMECDNHLVVVLDAHADAVEHDSDEDGALHVSAFDESLDTSPQPGHPSSCSSSSSSSISYIPHHSSHRRRDVIVINLRNNYVTLPIQTGAVGGPVRRWIVIHCDQASE